MKSTSIRVLLVDDEVDLVSSLRKRLLRKGFTVVGTLSGEEALAAAAQRTFDVAVVDLKMPGMDGLKVLEGLKQQQPMLRAIVLTGHGSLDAAHQAGLRSAVHFLQKPTDFDPLVECIQQAYDEKRQAQREAYEREVQEVLTSYRSPQEIMAATEHLRTKYEQ